MVLALAPVGRYGFEGSVPSGVTVRGRGVLSLDTDRYKDGGSSLRFSWKGQAELVIADPEAVSAFMTSPKGGLMMWVCSERSMPDPITVSFRDSLRREVCSFPVNMDFTGWRALWIRYEDMLSSGVPVGETPVKQRVKRGYEMCLRPSPTQAEGSICIDRLVFTPQEINRQNTPDAQLPDNNRYVTRGNKWHWIRLWEWEGYPRLSPSETIDEESLEKISKRFGKLVGKKAADASAVMQKLCLERLPDGTVKGAPIVSNDESTPDDVKMQAAFTALHSLALKYRETGDAGTLRDFFLLGDHILWQGVDYGSGMGTNHHYGYNIRGWMDSLWLMQDEIRSSGRMPRWRRALEYWSGIQECRLPFQKGRDEILDSWNTLTLPKVAVCLLQDTPALRQAYIESLARWMEGSMNYSSGTIGGIKVDGTAFHHGGHYPAYATGAFASLGSWFSLIEGTSFVPCGESRRCIKKALMAMHTSCNLVDWGIGISGRHPFGGHMHPAVVNAFGALALLGDLTGKGLKADPELGGAYLSLGGTNKTLTSALKKAGIAPAAMPEGFFVYNYGAFGIHRRKGWMVTLKAYNSDVWGSEIYTRDNRYGRYQSYGPVQVINSGTPPSAEASGFVEAGWDWNRIPGTTTVHLPWDRLDSPNKGTLMERNDSRFPGVSSLEGKNGVLAFTYVEKDRRNFCPGATATKSVFCFDNRLVFIGTGISNDSDCPTETTLFQQNTTGARNEVALTRKGKGAIVSDLSGNRYILKDASSLVVRKCIQESPDNTGRSTGRGEFAWGVINHGVAPRDASYEYLMLVEPAPEDAGRFLRKPPYEVLHAGSDAHVVRDIPTGITAYASYQGYSGPDIVIPAETIVMERPRGGGRVMSVCTPDLGISEKSYTTPEEGRPLSRTVKVRGELTVPGESPAVSARATGGWTEITVLCLHGQPVEFEIK